MIASTSRWIAGAVLAAGCALAGLVPSAGSSVSGPVPAAMLGRYLSLAADHPERLVFELRLRPSRDPICVNLGHAVGRPGTCFTLGKKGVPLSIDPGARGLATVAGGRLRLNMTLVPYGRECEGSVTLYAVAKRSSNLIRTGGTCGDRRYVRQR